jgi:adenine-specific DNA-methyltransferase
LRPLGSIYLFAGPHLATQVELAVSRHFRMLNRIVWCKPSGRHNGCSKESLRKYLPQTEHIMFAESKKRKPFVFEPIRAYLDKARSSAGISHGQVDQVCGNQMSGHWFGKSQWTMPSRGHYETLQSDLNVSLKPYNELFSEYKSLKQSTRYFSVSKYVPTPTYGITSR